MLAVLVGVALLIVGLFGLLHIRHILRCIYTLDELQHLGFALPPAARRGHAVVLGGSWTGMLAAAVLARYFARVTVLERDPPTELNNPDTRRGVPHAAQSHVIGRYAIEFVNALLPQFENALREGGGRAGGDMGVNFHWFHRGRWRMHQPLGLPMWFASRPLAERTLRQTVLHVHDNVILRSGVRVTGLLAHDHRLLGVQTEAGEERAEFIVDCTGRNSQATRWLSQSGWDPVEENVVDAATFYATRRFERAPQPKPGDWAMTWHGHHKTGRRGHFAGAITVEDDAINVWAVQTGNALRASADNFAAFFNNMGSGATAMTEQVHGSETYLPQPRGEACAFGAGASKRRRFAAVRELPDNLAVLGDAVCCTNPAYGLGLSLAASTVACLAEVLHQRSRATQSLELRGVGREVNRRVAWRTLGPWILTTSEDYRLPHTEGPHKHHPGVRFLHWYVDNAFNQAHSHAYVDATVLRVVTLMAHPLQVFEPRLIWHVLKQSFQRSTFAEVTYERTH